MKKRDCFFPVIIKPFIRFIYYKNQRKKVFREKKIRTLQNVLISEEYSQNTQNLIVFFIDGADWKSGLDKISGGILSIASIYEETAKLKNLHLSDIIMMTHQQAHLFLKHTQFPNNIQVFRFEQLFSYFLSLKKILIHIPEYLVPLLASQMIEKIPFFEKIKDVQINILNQNITLMPSVFEIEKLKQITGNITQTTAHEKYSTSEYFFKYGIPLHKLSVYGSPEKYKLSAFNQKENLLVVSPDEHPQKEKILIKIKKSFPFLQIKIIEKMPYSEYLNTISKAKFTITFGEGLDFYFVESVFSGGIGIAVYNDVFFTDSYKNLFMLYNSFKELENKIIADITTLFNEEQYNRTNKSQFKICAELYNYAVYKKNIELFYKREYTFK